MNETFGIRHLMAPVMGRIRQVMVIAMLGTALRIFAVLCLVLSIRALWIHTPPWPFLWLCLGLILGNIGLRVLGANKAHHAAFRLEHILRTRLSTHLARVPMGFVLSSGSGALTKIIQDDVKNLHVFVADSTPFLGRSLASPVITLGVLLCLDLRLALTALLVMAAGLLAGKFSMKNRDVLQKQYDRENEQINSRVVEFVQAMPVVRTFDTGAASFSRYQSALDRFLDFFIQWLGFRSVSARASLLLLGPLPTLFAISVFGVQWLEAGTLEPVNFIACLLLGTGLAESIIPLMWLFHFIHKANGCAKRIQMVLAEPVQPVPDPPQTPGDSSIELEKVWFTYKTRTKPALSNVSFKVPAGSVTALAGPSGSGKTTIARLIPRFWDTDKGAVKIGNVDVRNIAPEQLSSQLALVFQDTFLFNDTIAANISMGCPGAAMADIKAAAKAAQAHEFIMDLPQGYQTLARDRGTGLSGGQRQRITIARAILQDRPIVVLDEATAFTDPENEALLIKALANLTRDKTVILIAHRLETVKDADQILVMDKGCLVEQGTHRVLMDRGGLYARLWKSNETARSWTLDRSRDKGELS